MDVRLLVPTRDRALEYRGLIWLAARTCYSDKSPNDLWSDFCSGVVPMKRLLRVLSHVIVSGHHSTIEHITFTFGISGVSRVLTHQLVRHRIGVAFDQQSQRYVRVDGDVVVPPSVARDDRALALYEEMVRGVVDGYHRLVELGIPEEDARFLLPQGVKTNLVMTVNLRQLIHMSGLRLCTLAQWEIRQLFKKIRKEVMAFDPLFGKLLVPKCVWMGYCDEKRNADGHCKIRPYRPSPVESFFVGEVDGDGG